MAIHFGIIADFLNSKNDPAFFDVAADTPSTSVRYTVYQPGVGDRTVTVPFTNQFATSPDLFNVGGSPVALPALVSAETVDPSGAGDQVASAAVVRQKKATLFIPQNNDSGPGRSFLFPLGDLGSTSGGRTGANLVVANPNSSPIAIDYQLNGAPQPRVTLDRTACTVIPLTVAPSWVQVNASGNAIVALAIIGKGQDFAITLITPIA